MWSEGREAPRQKCVLFAAGAGARAQVPSVLLSVGTQTDSPRSSVDRSSNPSRRSIGFLNTISEQMGAPPQGARRLARRVAVFVQPPKSARSGEA